MDIFKTSKAKTLAGSRDIQNLDPDKPDKTKGAITISKLNENAEFGYLHYKYENIQDKRRF